MLKLIARGCSGITPHRITPQAKIRAGVDEFEQPWRSAQGTDGRDRQFLRGNWCCHPMRDEDIQGNSDEDDRAC
jgi:hypothetical protein